LKDGVLLMLQLDHELQGCSPSVFYLDGDGEFDAIDIAILEEGNSASTQSKNRNTGCCLSIALTGATFAGVAYTISQLIT
jgi:hypothetical protein